MTIDKKSVSLVGRGPHRPSIRDLAANTPLLAQPHFNVMKSQDTTSASSRRIVLWHGLTGGQDLRVGDDDPDTGDPAPIYRDRDTWATACSGIVTLTPGCFLEAHLMYLPSGATQHEIASAYYDSGGYGAMRIAVNFRSQNGTDETGTLYFSRGLETSAREFNGIGSADGAAWSMLRSVTIPAIQPNGLSDAATLEDYSQFCTAEIEVQIQGSPRIVALVIYEVPVAHAQDDAPMTPPSVHGYPPSQTGFPTAIPQTRKADSLLVSERRFGTRRTIDVEGMQTLYTGPVVFHWDCYREDPTLSVDVREPVEVTTTFFSAIDIPSGEGHTYAEGDAAWIVPGVFAQPHAWNDADLILRNRAAVMPVRVWVYAVVPSGEAYVRVQASDRSYVDIEVTDTDTAGNPSWHTTTGYLESPTAYDSGTPKALQILARAATGTLELYAVVVQYLIPKPEIPPPE